MILQEKIYFRSRIIQSTKKYTHIFIDLDSTVWDFEQNAREAYKEIYNKFGHNLSGVESIEKFTQSYLYHNNILWALYREEKTEKLT